MYLYDSVQKSKLLFEPIIPGKASLYVCGPTVYDDAHLGHAKSAIVFDLLRRVLIASGYETTYVRNITDIDDKIIKKMNESGQSLDEITSFYTKRYTDEMTLLNVFAPDIEPKATQSIEAMESMINTLLDKEYAYISDDKTVYFESSKDSNYFSLSNRQVDENDTQSRIDDAHGKRNPSDFALWKPKKEDENVSFSASFGEGRPGWHIECSAMIEKVFGHEGDYSIDIHGGGADLLFPHHENEAAQSRCATGKELAKYWVHNGFVNINGEKMSKSLGNSFFLKDALAKYHGEVLRFYLISTHYRSNFNFSEEDLIQTKKRLDKVYRLKKRIYGMKVAPMKSEFQTKLLEALQDDLNTSKAFALIDEMVSTTNDAMDANPKDKVTKKELAANLRFLDEVMGIATLDAFSYFQFGIDETTIQKIEALITARSDAKKAKDFEAADTIRDEITALGIAIMDTPDGTKWEAL